MHPVYTPYILLVGVVYPILVVSIAVVDSATWCRVSTRIYGQPLRLVVVCLPPPAVEHHHSTTRGAGYATGQGGR